MLQILSMMSAGANLTPEATTELKKLIANRVRSMVGGMVQGQSRLSDGMLRKLTSGAIASDDFELARLLVPHALRSIEYTKSAIYQLLLLSNHFGWEELRE